MQACKKAAFFFSGGFLLLSLGLFSCQKADQDAKSIPSWNESVLVASQGTPFRLGDLKAPYKLVYFGYTRCTESCPVALASMSMASAMLARRAQRLSLVFISIDPAYDTPKRLEAYTKSFRGNPIHAFTASSGQLASLRTLLQEFGLQGIVLSQSDKSASALGKRHEIPHTPFLYLLSKENRILRTYSAGLSARALRDALQKEF